MYPLADIRLLEIMYSLPADLFKPKPYSRALFRNLAIGILPEKVRLQPKRSGAKTLAFADYWIHTKSAELLWLRTVRQSGSAAFSGGYAPRRSLLQTL